MNQPTEDVEITNEQIEHMADILYRKITNEDDMFVSLCEIVEHLSDIPGLRERIEKLG